MWVPLVENREFDTDGADYFVKKNIDHILSVDPQIDTLILGCTHYPLLLNKIRCYTPAGIQIVSQGDIVAHSLQTYLEHHTEMGKRCSKRASRKFYTTESEEKFIKSATIFLNDRVEATHIVLNY